MFYQLLRSKIKKSKSLSLKRGDFIYREGQSPENIYFIEQGLVGLFHVSESGKETFLRVFGENNIFGHRSFFAEDNYHANAMTLGPTKLVLISVEECQRICQESPELLKEVTKILAQDLGDSELRLAGLQDKSAPKRVMESLVYFKLKYPDHLWTRKEMAEYSGTTLETVARVMAQLEKDGLIKKIGRNFEILDIQRMLQS